MDKSIKVLVAVAAWGVFSGSAVATAVALPSVSLDEHEDWVFADSSYNPDDDPSAGHGNWPVVRLDVTNHSAAPVFSVIVGARPGVYASGKYAWSDSSTPAMRFGNPWEPVGFDHANPPYLPQRNNARDGFGHPIGATGSDDDGVLDWDTQLLPVTAGRIVELADGVGGVALSFRLPEDFADYSHVYQFSTMGPFVACGGGCSLDSVPILAGQTFSFYVTGGLASPLVYLDKDDFAPSGSLAGTFNGGSITAAVPEPSAYILFAAGLALIGALRRRSAPLAAGLDQTGSGQ